MPRQPATVVRLDGELVLRHAETIHARLTAALAEGDRVEVDIAADARVDLSLVQLLLAARHAAAARGGHLALARPADGPLLALLDEGGFLAVAETGAADTGGGGDAALWAGTDRARS